MSRACSMHGKRRDAYRVLVWKSDLDVDGTVILKWILVNLDAFNVDCIHLAHGRSQRLDFMKAVLSLWIQTIFGKSWISEQLFYFSRIWPRCVSGYSSILIYWQ
jgi:hypothetical protein